MNWGEGAAGIRVMKFCDAADKYVRAREGSDASPLVFNEELKRWMTRVDLLEGRVASLAEEYWDEQNSYKEGIETIGTRPQMVFDLSATAGSPLTAKDLESERRVSHRAADDDLTITMATAYLNLRDVESNGLAGGVNDGGMADCIRLLQMHHYPGLAENERQVRMLEQQIRGAQATAGMRNKHSRSPKTVAAVEAKSQELAEAMSDLGKKVAGIEKGCQRQDDMTDNYNYPENNPRRVQWVYKSDCWSPRTDEQKGEELADALGQMIGEFLGFLFS